MMFLRDLFLAWRKLVRRPGAALLAVISLALAIGFSTAAFSVVDGYYWRALPVRDPGRLAYAMVRDREGRIDEFGVRVAMGATPALLARQVIREALRLALVGVALGCWLALAGQHLLRGLLYGVSPWSLWMLMAAVALVTLVALAAAAVPARRAAHVDPIAALRVE